MVLKYIININSNSDNNSDSNETVNSILQNQLKISTRLLNKLIRNHSIFLNGKICDTRTKVTNNDVLIVDFNYVEDNSNIVPTKMDLSIIFEDDWILVVDKPVGVPVHPSRMHFSDSLSNGIRFYFDSIGLHKKIRPVNRLDLNTSGLVVFAKCEYVQESLINQMCNNILKKEYVCLVDGFLEIKNGTINLPIARKTGSIIERCVDFENGQMSVTHYEVLKEFCFHGHSYSLLKCILETGRTHQIRVHMSAIGHPIVGDTLYSTGSNLIDRQALHSYRIECIHPVTKQPMIWISEPSFDIF